MKSASTKKPRVDANPYSKRYTSVGAVTNTVRIYNPSDVLLTYAYSFSLRTYPQPPPSAILKTPPKKAGNKPNRRDDHEDDHVEYDDAYLRMQSDFCHLFEQAPNKQAPNDADYVMYAYLDHHSMIHKQVSGEHYTGPLTSVKLWDANHKSAQLTLFETASMKARPTLF